MPPNAHTPPLLQAAKKKKKNAAGFGWEVFNQDNLYKAYKKRTQKLEVDKVSQGGYPPAL